jgi:hypothetical protein
VSDDAANTVTVPLTGDVVVVVVVGAAGALVVGVELDPELLDGTVVVVEPAPDADVVVVVPETDPRAVVVVDRAVLLCFLVLAEGVEVPQAATPSAAATTSNPARDLRFMVLPFESSC